MVWTKDAGAVVRAMDARNLLRYQDDRQALEQWISVRTVLGSPQGASKDDMTPEPAGPQAPPASGTPSAGGDVRPAA
jgi:hypothetical protein